LSPPPYSQHSAPLRHLCSFPTRRSSDLLPVSDLTTVLSKVTIPLVVLPLVAFVMVVSVQLIMLMMTSANLIFHGMSPASTWAHRSEEHTSELQSRGHLVCRLLLEKKKLH